MKESVDVAVRMVGHLLEHHGCTGPFAADAKGSDVELDAPMATQWCFAGAIQVVSKTMGYCNSVWLDRELTSACAKYLNDYRSPILIWESYSFQPTTAEERLEIARKLQRCGL